jgi:transposase-like protein
MKFKEQECPYCGKSRPVIKSGLNSTGSQRYKCRSCVRYFTPQPKPMGYDDELKQKALQLYLEGTSLRSIGRILNVHHQSVANWVATSAERLPDQVQDTTPAETVEIDELFTYIGKKTDAST